MCASKAPLANIKGTYQMINCERWIIALIEILSKFSKLCAELIGLRKLSRKAYAGSCVFDKNLSYS